MSVRPKYTLYMFRQVCMFAGLANKNQFTVIDVNRAFKQHEKFTVIDVNRAFKQHERFSEKVQRAARVGNGVVGSIVFPGSSEHPECALLGDCVVSLAPGVAVITNPNLISRRGETGLYSRFFHTRSMQGENMNIYEMVHNQYGSGGDVLRIDNSVFVGESAQTTDLAHSRWRDICTLNGLKYYPVCVGSTKKNLKSLVSWLGPDIGIVGSKSVVEQIMQTPLIKKYEKKVYMVDTFEDTDMLRVNNTVFHHFGANIKHLNVKNTKITFTPIDISELKKIGGSLTSLCVPLQQ